MLSQVSQIDNRWNVSGDVVIGTGKQFQIIEVLPLKRPLFYFF